MSYKCLFLNTGTLVNHKRKCPQVFEEETIIVFKAETVLKVIISAQYIQAFQVETADPFYTQTYTHTNMPHFFFI